MLFKSFLLIMSFIMLSAIDAYTFNDPIGDDRMNTSMVMKTGTLEVEESSNGSKLEKLLRKDGSLYKKTEYSARKGIIESEKYFNDKEILDHERNYISGFLSCTVYYYEDGETPRKTLRYQIVTHLISEETIHRIDGSKETTIKYKIDGITPESKTWFGHFYQVSKKNEQDIVGSEQYYKDGKTKHKEYSYNRGVKTGVVEYWKNGKEYKQCKIVDQRSETRCIYFDSKGKKSTIEPSFLNSPIDQ